MLAPFTISPTCTLLFLTPAIHGILSKIRFTIEERQGWCCILGDTRMGKSALLRFLNQEFGTQPGHIHGLAAQS